MNTEALEWISGSDTGASSTALWRHMMGMDPSSDCWGIAYPHDPDDFGRCYRLLLRVPAWRLRIGEMAQYAGWSALAPKWDELTALWEAEAGGGLHRRSGSAPKLYAAMRELLAGLRRTA
jgi:hypothetical protein